MGYGCPKTDKNWYGAIEKIEITQDKRYALFEIMKLSGTRVTGFECSFFDLVSKIELQRLETGGHCAFSPQGDFILVVDRDYRNDIISITTKEFPSGKEIANFRLNFPTEGYISAYSITPNGKILAIGIGKFGTSGEVLLINLENGQLVHQWTAHSDSIRELIFSPDGSLLATLGEDACLKVWGEWP